MDENLPPPSYLGEYAGFLTRLAAYVIDLLIIAALWAIVAFIGNFIFDFFHMTGKYAQPILYTIIIITNGAIFLVYYLAFWMIAGQTPGKALLGVRIVRTDGTRLTIGWAIIRLIGYFFSLFLFIGYLMVLVETRRQALHDKMAGTLVVYAWTPDKNIQLQQDHPLRQRIQTYRKSKITETDLKQ